MSKLKSNKVECVGCHKIVESTHRHDYRTHACHDVEGNAVWFMVDGGLAYLRRGWGGGRPEDHYIERSEDESGQDEVPV